MEDMNTNIKIHIMEGGAKSQQTGDKNAKLQKKSYSNLIMLMSILMQTSGLWTSPKNRTLNLHVIALIFITYLVLICGVLASYFDHETISDAIDSSVIVVLIMLDLGQYMALIAKQKHLGRLIDFVESIAESEVINTQNEVMFNQMESEIMFKQSKSKATFEQSKSEVMLNKLENRNDNAQNEVMFEKSEVMDDYGAQIRSRGEFWSLLVTGANIVGVGMTFGAYLFKTKFYRLQEQRLLFPLKLPLDQKHPLIFALVLLIQVLGGIISCNFRLFASGMINGPLFMLTAEFQLLKRDFELCGETAPEKLKHGREWKGSHQVQTSQAKLEHESKWTRSHHRQSYRVSNSNEQLKRLIKKHNTLVSLCKDIEEVMSALILILYVICELLLCLQSFKLYKDWHQLSLEDVATGMTMLLQTLQHLFFYFYASQSLMSQTQDLHTSIYCSSWYKADIDYKKSMTIVLSRSVRPVILTAGRVLPVTFRSFLKGLQAAFSYFNLLRALTHS